MTYCCVTFSSFRKVVILIFFYLPIYQITIEIMDDVRSPDVTVVTDEARAPPIGEGDNEEEPPRADDDIWEQDEANFCRNYEAEGSSPIYEAPRPIEPFLPTTQEIQAHASAEALEFLRKIHETCMRGDAPPIQRACAVIETSQQDVSKMDAASVDAAFHARVLMVDLAAESIRQDVGMDEKSKTEALGVARATVQLLVSFNNMVISLNNVDSVCAAAATGQFVSSVDASWRYMASADKPKPIQALYMIVYAKAVSLKYARYKGSFMKRVVTEEGYITNAWEPVTTFEKFVYQQTNEPNGEVIALCTSQANIMNNVAELLGKTCEASLPWLSPDRTVFAFRNGCYMAKPESFIAFTKHAPPQTPDGNPCPTACKFHNVDINPEWLLCRDPMEIPTPLMDKIMMSQKLRKRVRRVYFSMLGRSMYNLGEFDNWQVFLFVKGAAETGKSTLLKFVASFYNTEDVGILSNNVEATFGASMLADKFLVIADDVGENFTLDQQLFQNMTSGNDVSLPVKNKTALVLKWATQLLFSGNVLPGYRDNFGSFSRRLLIIYYSQIIAHVDPTIPERLKAEMGAAIIKCNRMYRNMVRRLFYLQSRLENPMTFWDAIPEEFLEQKRNVMQSANAVMNFLHSGALTFGKSLYMPKTVFTMQLMEHCTMNGIPRPRFGPTLYEGPFGVMGVKMTTGKSRRIYPIGGAVERTEMWVIGCDLATAAAMARATADSTKAADDAAAAFARGNKRPAPNQPMDGAPPASRPRI